MNQYVKSYCILYTSNTEMQNEFLKTKINIYGIFKNKFNKNIQKHYGQKHKTVQKYTKKTPK